jgi:lipopolysaccharide biosynthesis glycosyltransferase
VGTGLEMLGQSGVFPPITELHLQGNQLTSSGCKQLFLFIAQTKVSKINLNNNLVSNDFATWLSTHLKEQRLEHSNYKLECISLADNGIKNLFLVNDELELNKKHRF